MASVPPPPIISAPDLNHQRVRFRFKYARRKGSLSWAKLSKTDQKFTLKKLRELSRLKLHQFKTCGARPRKWTEKLPSPPPELSEDIADMLADYFNINGTIRVFGYILGRDFQVIWFSSGHRHSK